MHKKVILFSVGAAVLLAGCFGGSSDKKEVVKKIEGFHSYETEEFRMQVPDAWETLTPLNFKSNISKNTLAAFRNNLRDPSFTANIVVLKNELASEISSTDYAKALNEKLKNNLSSYKEILIEKFNVNVEGKESESLFTHVEGRERPEADLKRFIQVSAVKEKNAFNALGAYLAKGDEGLAKKIETSIRSFEVK